MKRNALFTGLACLLFCATAFAASSGIGVWDADLQGGIKSGADHEKLDLKNDLTIGDDDIVQFRLDSSLLGSKAYLHYYQAANHGATNRSLAFNGILLNGSGTGTIESKLEQTVVDVGAAKSLRKTGPLQVELAGGLRYLELSSKLRDSSGQKANASLKAVVPTIGLGAATHLTGDLSAKAVLSGVDIRFGGKKVDTYDLRYGLEYNPTENLSIGAGVEKAKIFIEDGNNLADLHREGKYFEIVVKF